MTDNACLIHSKMQIQKIVGILGVGEVGSAIKKACKPFYQVYTKDCKKDSLKGKKVAILHVCIPYVSWRQFSIPVLEQIKKNRPALVIINSTVAPGTSRKIQKQSGVPTVHAPIMGVHPDLYTYLFKFPKFIGPTDDKGAKLARKHFIALGLTPRFFNSPEETELAKLMETTYYGLAIVFCQWLKKYCDRQQLDFENVYTVYNKAYNKGYQKSLPQVCRPILKPMPGKIGGHCVIPNAKILKKIVQDPFSNLILNLDEVVHEKN